MFTSMFTIIENPLGLVHRLSCVADHVPDLLHVHNYCGVKFLQVPEG